MEVRRETQNHCVTPVPFLDKLWRNATHSIWVFAWVGSHVIIFVPWNKDTSFLYKSHRVSDLQKCGCRSIRFYKSAKLINAPKELIVSSEVNASPWWNHGHPPSLLTCKLNPMLRVLFAGRLLLPFCNLNVHLRNTERTPASSRWPELLKESRFKSYGKWFIYVRRLAPASRKLGIRRGWSGRR